MHTSSKHVEDMCIQTVKKKWAISQDYVTYYTGVTKALMSLHIYTVSSRLSVSHNGPSHKIMLLIALVSDKGSDESTHMHSLIKAFRLT